MNSRERAADAARDRNRVLWPVGGEVTPIPCARLQGLGAQWGPGVMWQLFPVSLWGVVSPARVWILSGGHIWGRGCRYGLGNPGTQRRGRCWGYFWGVGKVRGSQWDCHVTWNISPSLSAVYPV